MLTSGTSKGFTLVEVLIVCAILGIVLSIALPSMRAVIFNFQIRALAESISNGIQIARATAVQRNEPVVFTLAKSGSTYTLAWSVDTDAGTNIQSKSTAENSNNLTLNTLPATSNKVTFNGTGRVISNTDTSGTMNTINIDSSVLTATESNDLRIRILSGGLIKLCNPNAAATSVTACP